MFGGLIMVLMFLVALFLILLVSYSADGAAVWPVPLVAWGDRRFGTKAGDLFTRITIVDRSRVDPAVRLGREVLQHRRLVQHPAGRGGEDHRRARAQPAASSPAPAGAAGEGRLRPRRRRHRLPRMSRQS